MALAAQAGLLDRSEVLAAYHTMQEDVRSAAKRGVVATIGLTIYMPYPARSAPVGGLLHPEYDYQNGGDVRRMHRHGNPINPKPCAPLNTLTSTQRITVLCCECEWPPDHPIMTIRSPIITQSRRSDLLSLLYPPVPSPLL